MLNVRAIHRDLWHDVLDCSCHRRRCIFKSTFRLLIRMLQPLFRLPGGYIKIRKYWVFSYLDISSRGQKKWRWEKKPTLFGAYLLKQASNSQESYLCRELNVRDIHRNLCHDVLDCSCHRRRRIFKSTFRLLIRMLQPLFRLPGGSTEIRKYWRQEKWRWEKNLLFATHNF